MIDRYEILRKLATGGMAELFLAKQSGLEGFEKVVVIKRILSHLAQDNEFVSMFLDEARIAAKLSHPNIVQIYDLGKAEDSYYIAMEYVSGRNVQHILAKQEEKGSMVPIEHACRMIAGVCDGLHYAHSRKDYDGQPLNIVHRDISPQNILVSFAGGVKVVDFGIAKASTQLAQTRAGVLKGKYAYMSPEQVRGQKIDHRSDIFALGLVMYEMLTGRRAFERDSSLKTLKAIVQEKPLNPRELNPDIPIEVVKLLSRALEKNPDRRYKNAQEMQLALEDFLESSPKKSNNVRLSRYLYELFDDELNSDSGTMVVQGIGEVIIPTGGKPKADADVVNDEEIDSKTLSAALAPSPPGAKERDEPQTQTASGKVVQDGEEGDGKVGRRKPSEPGVRVVRDDQRGASDDDDDELAAEREAPEGTDPSAAPPMGKAPFEDEDDSVADEPEDKTIPVYDIEDHERERERRDALRIGADVRIGADARIGPDDEREARTDGSLFPPASVQSATLGTVQDSGPSQEGIGAKREKGDDARDKARAAALLAKVDALAEGFDVALKSGPQVDTLPPPGIDDDDPENGDGGKPPEWEDPTTQAPGGGGLHSDEAVVGPNGIVPVRGESAAIRPPGGPGDIRPSAKVGGRPSAGGAVVKEVARVPSVSGPTSPGAHEAATATASSSPMPPVAPAAPLVEPTPPTSVSGSRRAAATTRGGGFRMTPPVIAALAVIGLLVVLTLGGLVALLFMGGRDPPGKPGAPRILLLDTDPSGVELRYKGVSYTTPATLIVEQGAVAVVEVVQDGKATAYKLQIPVGSAPVPKTMKLSEPTEP